MTKTKDTPIIRLLKADEIECRVGTVSKDNTGCSLLLYKDARVDMRMLDEVFGPTNWKRSHEVINGSLFCTLSIWDSEKKEWISKQDVGTESNGEQYKEKGQASDAFKRAGFNWGIGRELYTAPFIWVKLTYDDLNSYNKVKTSFIVDHIEYNEEKREITALKIVDKSGAVRYTYPSSTTQQQPASAPKPTFNGTRGVFTGAQLKQAIAEMNACTTKTQVNAVWNKYQDLQNNADFKNACMAKCQEFPK